MTRRSTTRTRRWSNRRARRGRPPRPPAGSSRRTSRPFACGPAGRARRGVPRPTRGSSATSETRPTAATTASSTRAARQLAAGRRRLRGRCSKWIKSAGPDAARGARGAGCVLGRALAAARAELLAALASAWAAGDEGVVEDARPLVALLSDEEGAPREFASFLALVLFRDWRPAWWPRDARRPRP